MEIADQWGKITVRRKYEMISENVFKVTEFQNGVNIFLPCKYALETFKEDLLVETSLHSNSGRLRNNEQGYAITRYKRYNDKVRFAEKMETSYFDENNLPVISKTNGVHRIKYEFDDSDNQILEIYFDISDKPAMIKGIGSYGFKSFFDQDNRVIKNQFLGLNGKTDTTSYGISAELMEYTNGYLTRLTRTDSLNHITRSSTSGDGIAIYKMEYDGNGNQVKKMILDEAGNPTKDQGGVSVAIYKFSKENMQTSTEYFDEFGNPVNNRSKIHFYSYEHDSLGRTVQIAYFDKDGIPVREHINEVYLIKTTYDSSGRKYSESYWKTKDTAMPRWNGVYEMRQLYNDDGQVVEYDYYDQNGNLMRTNEGYSACKLLLDKDGVMYARQYLFKDELVNKSRGVSRGFSVIRYEYDSVGRIVQILFYGSQHEAVNAIVDISNPVQVHRIQFFYRGSRIVEQWYYTIYDKEPFLKLDCLKNDYLNPNGINTGRKNLN